MPSRSLPSWAPLSAAERDRLDENVHRLAADIRDNGPMPFIDYMERVLYDPESGYYSRQAVFGEPGDYITAPTLSPLFGRALARQCAQVLEHHGGDVIEVGGGTGHLALDILTALEPAGPAPDRYWLVERSAGLRERAQALIAHAAPQWRERVHIVAEWPRVKARIILANELLDALPTTRFRVTADGIRPLHVAASETGLGFVPGPRDRALEARLAPLALPVGYESEVTPASEDWLAGAAEHLDSGLILVIDYGFPQSEFYHPDRGGGTVMCHFRQHAHPDPLILPGLQDITAHVDFTALARAGARLGLDIAGYTSQAGLLLALGLAEEAPTDLKALQAIKRLTLPHEMGELFKAIAFTRNLSIPLRGFALFDRRHTLGL